MATAFVLSGGASLGSVQVGMLRALYERGIEPDMLLGTSVGAVNAVYVAGRPPTPATADGLADVWDRIGTTTIFPVDPLAGLLGLLGVRDHFMPDRGLRNLVSGGISIDRLEDAPIETHLVATDARTGHDVLLSEGDAVEATLASAAIPGVYPTVRWGDRRLMDGGVANNTPISHAIELGAERVYVLPSGFACALDSPPRGALASGIHALTMLIQSRLVADVERRQDHAELIVIPPPCPIDVEPVDFRRTRELIERSHAVAADFLDADELPACPRTAELLPHHHGAGVPA